MQKPEATVRDCNVCPHWKGMANRRKGHRIPGGSGKCTWINGPAACRPMSVRGRIGSEKA